MIETGLATTLGSEQFASLKRTGAQQTIDELINLLQTAKFMQ